MKKTIAKLVFVLCCIGGIIFLLLPFLETTPPATTDLKSAQPQISSSNPLAAIAKRLGALFGRRNSAREARLLTANSRDGLDYLPPAFGPAPAYAPQHAAQELLAAPATGQPTQPAQTDVPVPAVSNQEYGNASIQTDSGEWVLVRQTAPQNAEPGMHEVNVHENPYDRYIKQERARRFQPTAAQPQIPDSKWARLLRPIQSFFGLDGAHPVANRPAPLYRDTDKTRRGNGTQAMDGNRQISLSARRTRLPWPDISPARWNNMTEAERQLERERRSAAEFVEIMSGTRAAEESAAIVAEATYPDSKDKDKREDYQRRLTEENKQKIKEGLLAAMQSNAQGKQQVDELEYIMTGCSNASLPKKGCDPNQTEITGSLFSSDEVTAWQEKSRQLFLDKTHYAMPDDLPLMPVLGPTTPQTIANMAGSEENIEKTIDIYQVMYAKNNCASQDCFLIPNSIQSTEQLRDSFKLANTKLVTDPDNFYQTFKPDLIRYEIEQAKKQQAADPTLQISEKELIQQAEKKFIENAPNWIFVTSEQLKQIYDVHTLQAANPKNRGSNIPVVVLYQTNPLYTEKMYHALGDSPIFGYAKEPLTTVMEQVTADNTVQADKQTVENTSTLVSDSISDNVHTAFQEVGKVTKSSVSEGTRAGLSQQITGDQTGTNIQNAVKNRNTRTNSGKK